MKSESSVLTVFFQTNNCLFKQIVICLNKQLKLFSDVISGAPWVRFLLEIKFSQRMGGAS